MYRLTGPLLILLLTGCSPTSDSGLDLPPEPAELATQELTGIDDSSGVDPVFSVIAQRFAAPKRQRELAQRVGIVPGESLLLDSVSTGFRRDAEGWVPRFRAGPAQGKEQTAETTYGATLEEGFALEAVRSGVSIQVRPVDLSASDSAIAQAKAEPTGGYILYQPLHARVPAVIHRPHPGGTEDYWLFEARPDVEQLSYSVELGSGVAGLRLVSNVLEFLDREGYPRLRVRASAAVAERGGDDVPLTLDVTDCRVQRSPAVPWLSELIPQRRGIAVWQSTTL